jgi:18S rRNA (guanine1575-N7)-methyltransferase
MVGSGKYVSRGGKQNEMLETMDVDEEGIPRGLDGDEEEAEGGKRSVMFERRRARENGKDKGKKSKKKTIDKAWILKKKEVRLFSRLE